MTAVTDYNSWFAVYMVIKLALNVVNKRHAMETIHKYNKQ